MDHFQNIVPPEIWVKILSNLTDFQDCYNATKAVHCWDEALFPSRTSWLFGKAFPLLFEYLSEKDILHCRLVCKRWYHAVDHFLSYNIHHRPYMKDSGSERIKYLNFDDPLNPLLMLLFQKGLLHHNLSSPTNNKKILSRPLTYIRSPFIIESVMINELATSSLAASNWKFLEAFGQFIKYIVIDIQNYNEIDGLTRIFELLKLLPNLQKLEINGNFSRPSSCDDLAITGERLAKILESKSLKDLKGCLLKLETLNIDISGIYNTTFQQEIVALWSENLQSLKLRNMFLPSNFNSENLVDLDLECSSDKKLLNLLAFKFPLRRLYLMLSSTVDSKSLFKVLSTFSKTLKYVGLKFVKQGSRVVDMSQAKVLNNGLVPVSDNASLKGLSYMSPDLLVLPHVQSFSIEGELPLSLNFLLSMCHSLEYLYVDLQRYRYSNAMADKRFHLDHGRDSKKPKEEVDLLEFFEKLPSPNNFILYKSNIWKKLKKLKGLSVNIYRPYVKEEYRRDVYEAFK